MRGLLIISFTVLCLTLQLVSCSSSKAVGLQSFTPVAVDMQRIDQKDYAEIVDIVNKNYADSEHSYGNASVLKEEASFIYLRVFSVFEDGACYRFSIDRHWSKIVNIQPDCSIAIE